MTDPDKDWDIPQPGSLVEVLKTYAGINREGRPIPTMLKFKEQMYRGCSRIDHRLLLADGVSISDFDSINDVPEKYCVWVYRHMVWLNREDVYPEEYKPRHWTEYGHDFLPGDVGMVLKVRRNHLWVQFSRGQGWVDKNVLRIIPPWDDEDDE